MRMYGEKIESETYQVTSQEGIIKTYNTTPGYTGLFRANITHADGSLILDHNGKEVYDKAEYFYDDMFTNWHIIQKAMDDGLEDYIIRFTSSGSEISYNMQCEFGGDGSDGIIDFFTPSPIPMPPKVAFTIDGNNYLMTWYYVEDDKSESVNINS